MNQTVKKYLSDREYEVSDSMSAHISLWKQWYCGKVDSFHKYKVWNGEKTIESTMASLQLGKTVCEQWANLLFNEKVKIAVDHEPSQTFLDSVLDDNNAWIKLNEFQEKKSALGTVAYVPYYTSKGIRINYITAENMVPLTWENGVISELAVYSEIKRGKDKYYYMQLFTLDDGYQIENIVLHSDGGKVEKVALDDMPGFENVEEIIYTKSETRPFVIDRPNIVNNLDMDSPFGVSVFANAIDTMEFCDLMFDSYRNEFVLGRKRIMVTGEMLNMKGGGKLSFDPNNPVYQFIPAGTALSESPFIKELDMSIRSGEHETGLNRGLNTFSSQCGLGENYYRFDSNAGAATATQIISENNTMFRTLKKHEIILEAALVDLSRLILEIGVRDNLAQGIMPESDITVTFDDSIIEDKEAKMTSMKHDVDSGYIRPELYISEKHGVTEEQARGMMPKSDETGGGF